MWRTSIRFQITALATAAVAVVLVVAGVALVVAHRITLTSNIDATLVQRTDDIVALMETSALPPEELAGNKTEGFAQWVDKAGVVVASTANLLGAPPLPIGLDVRLQQTIQNVDGLEVDDDTFRVLTRRIDGGLLHVATTYDVVSESNGALSATLAVAIPILVAILALVVWWLVGRTLRPVEEIRAEVAEIGLTDLHRRVPEPESDDEIAQLAGTMNEMLERVEVSIERQQRFVADASHELRSPLTRMRLDLEVTLADADDPEERNVLSSTLDEVVALQFLVVDLLLLARADAGQDQMPYVNVDLDDLIVREARRIQSHERVDLDISRVSAALVLGDSAQLTRAFRNLLDNAEQHAASRISLSLEELDGQAVLTITDDGSGISAQDADRVFERFGRLDEARSSSTGGTGLGLAIAREIVERHRGSILLARIDEPGATFEVRLPLAK